MVGHIMEIKKIRPIALYNGHEHVYNGYYPDMTCAINIPDGYEFKEMKVEGDIPTGVGEYENTGYVYLYRNKEF